jgi:hypothetical protein
MKAERYSLAVSKTSSSSSSSYPALQPFLSLGLIDNSLPTVPVLCLLPPKLLLLKF